MPNLEMLLLKKEFPTLWTKLLRKLSIGRSFWRKRVNNKNFYVDYIFYKL